MFKEMDFDKSGAISRHELREGMPDMGVDLSQNDCDWLMLQARTEKKDEVGYAEFVALLARFKEEWRKRAPLHIRLYDGWGSFLEFLSRPRLRGALKKMQGHVKCSILRGEGEDGEAHFGAVPHTNALRRAGELQTIKVTTNGISGRFHTEQELNDLYTHAIPGVLPSLLLIHALLSLPPIPLAHFHSPSSPGVAT